MGHIKNLPRLKSNFAQENLREKINCVIRDVTRDYEGTPYVCEPGSPKDKTQIDCSGLAARICADLEGLNHAITIDRTSQNQFTALKDSGVPFARYEKISNIPPLQESMILFLDEGPTKWQQDLIDQKLEVKREDGVNHVVMPFRDEWGNMMISESTRAPPFTCTHAEPMKDWLARKSNDPKIQKIFVLDMVQATEILIRKANCQPQISHEPAIYR